jgi:hypothetical protein
VVLTDRAEFMTLQEEFSGSSRLLIKYLLNQKLGE